MSFSAFHRQFRYSTEPVWVYPDDDGSETLIDSEQMDFDELGKDHYDFTSDKTCYDFDPGHSYSTDYFDHCLDNHEYEDADASDTDLDDSNTLLTYERVAQEVKPVPGVFPEDARLIRQSPEDPAKSSPELSQNPPEFTPGERLALERLAEMDVNQTGFLWPEEEKLFSHILKLNERALAFEEAHRGTLRQDYFSPYILPVIPHVPWECQYIPIPPGIRDKVVKLPNEKL